MKSSKFNEILVEGIAQDTFTADLNYHIYKIIHDKIDISKLNKTDQIFFNYILNNAKDISILSIARVYDSESKKYKTRCIDELLKNSNSISVHYPFDIHHNKWIRFKSNYQLIFDKMNVNDIQPSRYLEHLISYYKDFKSSDSSYKNLKCWRDKILAHNDPFDSTDLKINFKEIEFLITIPKSIIEYANIFMETGNYISIFNGKNKAHFINTLISKYVG